MYIRYCTGSKQIEETCYDFHLTTVHHFNCVPQTKLKMGQQLQQRQNYRTDSSSGRMMTTKQRHARNYFLFLILAVVTILNLTSTIIRQKQYFIPSGKTSINTTFQSPLRNSSTATSQQQQQLSLNRLDPDATTDTATKNRNNNNIKCIQFDAGDGDENDGTSSTTLDILISTSNQIFITMPAKAAGSSLKAFTNICMSGMKNTYSKDNFPNLASDAKEEFLMSSLKLPNIITSHSLTDQVLIDIVQHSSTPPRQVLHIHMYRDETSRLLSGIKEVINLEVCRWTSKKAGFSPLNLALPDESYCMISEQELIQMIQSRTREIGYGNVETLTCNFYDAVDTNHPNLVFMHYSHANRLQAILAKHHCPELLLDRGGAKESNTSKGKSIDKIFVKLKNPTVSAKQESSQNTDDRVTLNEWLEAKANLLEWSLQLKTDATCQGRTKQIQDSLMQCPNQIVRI